MQYEIKELYGEKNKHKGNVTLNSTGEATLSFPRVYNRAPLKLKRARVEFMTTYGLTISGIALDSDPPLYQEWECRYEKKEEL